MRKSWWMLVCFLLSLGLNVGILATLAVQRLGTEPEPRAVGGSEAPGPVQRMAERLQLAGDGRERFVSAHRQLAAQLEEGRRRAERARREVRRLLVTESPDEGQLAAAVGELGAALTAQELRVVDHVLEMRRLLGPRQERLYLEALRRWGPEGLRQRRWHGPRAPGEELPPSR